MGGSRIAIRLAALAEGEFKFKIIENNKAKCRALPEKCPNCDIVQGDARDIEVLRDESITDYDAFVALTDSSETNILTCLTAKELGIKKTIAEVEDLQFISEAEGLNIGTSCLHPAKYSRYFWTPTSRPPNALPWPTRKWPKLK